MVATLREALALHLKEPSKLDPAVSNAVGIVLALSAKAYDGDTAAARLIAELAGEMKQQVEVSGEVAKVSLGDWGKPHGDSGA